MIPVQAPSPAKDWRSGIGLPLHLFAGFMVAGLCTVLIALFTFYSIESRAAAVERMKAAIEAVTQLNTVQSAVQDAETGQRGFLLTGDERYLEPYLAARSDLPQNVAKLRALLAGDAAQMQRLDQLDGLIDQKMSELAETIEARRQAGPGSAMPTVMSDRGRLAMNAIRRVTHDIRAAQAQEQDTRREEWEAAVRLSSRFTWASSAVLLVLVLAAGMMTARENRAKLRQNWVKTGLMGLSTRLQGDLELATLGQNALDHVARWVDASVGTAYAARGAGLERFGGYALAGDAGAPQTLSAPQGLLGQAMASRRTLHVRDVPPDYLPVNSSLGQRAPAELVVVPAQEDGEVLAVMELGFFRRLDDADLAFIEQAGEVLAAAVRAAADRTRLEALLEETRQQAEELQAQQEELRVNNEELEQQSRMLQESQTQMEAQQTELEQTNAQLAYQKERLELAQQALTRKADELEQASRYKSEFLANMSHELRTPLNSTLILAKLLADNKPGNLLPDQVRYAQTISSAGHDLLALINDILDLSRIEAGQATVNVESIALGRTLRGIVDPLQPLAQEKKLALRLGIDDQVPETIDTDPLRLGQILKNLLSNALKFTERGEVALQVSATGDGMLTFAVSDTGIGIPSEQQGLIFEAFRQADGSTHRKYGGTGLGLSISRDLATLLGGRIDVRSAPGEGSVFTLRLPVAGPSSSHAASGMPPQSSAAPSAAANPVPPRGPAPAAEAAEPAGFPPAPAVDAPQPARPGHRSILLIEDDARFAEILRDLAQEMDFECIVAPTASEGLAAARHHQPSAIVLDIHLPDLSGLGVLDQLKHNPATRHIPVHVVSVADYTQEAMEQGAVGYALKPVKREEMASALRRLESKFTQGLRRVLVVEDDERQLESVRALLTNDNVEITGAATAGRALELLRATTFDCMVMDLNLPDLSGYELLARMAEEDGVAFPPVIVYTGRTLTRDEELQLRRFSRSIIVKDARSPERLLDEVTLFLHQVESTLPPAQRQMLAVARNREAQLDGRSVLVVEDDVRNVFALSSVLEPTGIRVQIARNGIEALRALEAAQAPGATAIDLVLMDIMMPEMDGYAAMREIRKRPEWRRLPIIALTAKAMKDDQEKCLAAGANDYIAKPLDVEKLLSLVRVWMPK